jgi:hypothetical protein
MLTITLAAVTLLAIAIVCAILFLSASAKSNRVTRAQADVEPMKAVLERRMREGAELRF